MKEYPIIMSSDMVKAILDGRKSQTRRVVKNLANVGKSGHYYKLNYIGRGDTSVKRSLPKYCPYGKVGDRLWVRETWAKNDLDKEIYFKADDTGDGWVKTPMGEFRPRKWKPSIHMPRWASRITLEITDIRVERLQEISELDAEREGVEPFGGMSPAGCKYQYSFIKLWNSLHKEKNQWEKNLWVWVISFKRIKP